MTEDHDTKKVAVKLGDTVRMPGAPHVLGIVMGISATHFGVSVKGCPMQEIPAREMARAMGWAYEQAPPH